MHNLSFNVVEYNGTEIKEFYLSEVLEAVERNLIHPNLNGLSHDECRRVLETFRAASNEAFKVWCEENNIFYYARPREDFFEWEAFELTLKDGKTSVILEDMS